MAGLQTRRAVTARATTTGGRPWRVSYLPRLHTHTRLTAKTKKIQIDINLSRH